MKKEFKLIIILLFGLMSFFSVNFKINAEEVHEHTFGDWVIIKDSNYFEEGLKERTCSCSYKEQEIIEKKKIYNTWLYFKGNKYYFNASSNYVTNWNKISNKWCLFNNNGIFIKCINNKYKKEFVKVNGKTYYFTKSKKPISSGFHKINKKMYYFDKDKALVKGSFYVDGKYYKTKKDGSISLKKYYKYKYRTLIYVNITNQKLTYYKNGKKKMEVDVITGKPTKYSTPTGVFEIGYKKKNVTLIGKDYERKVKYWMAFIGRSYGFHDAYWRWDYEYKDKNRYKFYGSHGCINMKTKDAKKLYKKVKLGTTVVITK